jgi:alpha-galactosidase
MMIPGAVIISVSAVASMALVPAPMAAAAPAHVATAARANSAAAAPARTALTTAASQDASPSYNGLALTPPMGWNDWYQYKCGITQAEVLANAQALVSSGLAADGYNYINLDDCWMAPTRAADGSLQADPTRFPNGIAWLADQIHAMGLRLGVYESFGNTTCQGKPGSNGHYQQDADTFASWGVDFLKFDYCGPPAGLTDGQAEADYQQMSQDLVATGRPIVYSQELPIRAGDANPANPDYLPFVSYSSQIANMWRVAPDETTNYDSTVFGHLAADLPLAAYAHPGAWNDLDMVMAGNSTFNWTVPEEETQMSIWAEMASPIIASADLTSMSPATLQVLGNKDVIAVDQDPLGEQGQLVAAQNGVDVVAKPLANGDVAVLLANTASTPEHVSTTAGAVGLPTGVSGAFTVQDLWANTTTETAGTIAATVPAESAMLLRVSPLHGDIDAYQPLTDLSVSPNVPPAYSGSQFTIAQPGQTITVPATFTNDGRQAVTKPSLALSGPSGWDTGAPVTAPAVPTGHQLDGSWQVTVPPGTPAGTYTLTGTASFTWGGTNNASSSAQASIQVAVAPAGTPYLDQLSWLSAQNGFGPIGIDKNYYGGPLTIHGVVYPHGLWVNSVATLYYYLGGNCTQFTASLGLDDSDKGTGAVDYQFYADGTKVYDSGVVTNSTPTVQATVNVTGAQVLELYVGEGNGTINYGNADFGSPQLTCSS